MDRLDTLPPALDADGFLSDRSPSIEPLDRWTIAFLLLSGFVSGALVTLLCFAVGVSHG